MALEGHTGTAKVKQEEDADTRIQGVCEKMVILILNFGNKKIFTYKKNYTFSYL